MEQCENSSRTVVAETFWNIVTEFSRMQLGFTVWRFNVPKTEASESMVIFECTRTQRIVSALEE